MVAPSYTLVRTGSGIPSFKGCHNSLKAKTLFFLAQERDSGRWYSAKQLHLILGLNLHSLRTHLKRWTDWGRLLRRQRGIYKYRIAADGAAWIERWQFLMPLDRYIEEIETWQAKRGE